MKQLDEIEELAKDVCAYQQRFGITAELVNGALKDQRIDALARALLAVMPVARAAEAWLKQPGIDWQRTQGSAFGRANHELANALDEMRRRLGGE